MKIAVIGIPGKWSSVALAEEIEKLSGPCPVIDMGEVHLDLAGESLWWKDQDLCTYDALVVKKISQIYCPEVLDRMEMLRFAEAKGVRIYSSVAGMSRLIDRLSCTVTLKAGGIAMPETFITESVAEAAAKLEEYGKAVFKPLFTTKARGMIFLEGGASENLAAIEAYQKAGNPVIYMQRFVKGPGRDLGISFLGGKYLGTYARVGSGNSWNTTTANGGRYAPDDPPQAWIDLARRAQALFDLDFTCVDLMETDEGPRVFEVSAFGGFKGLQEAQGINVAELYASYILETLNQKKA
ncbi:MAG: GAK system ATP-grasp enzyme [bacterium]|nr:GAK system ATP-grasp enzyme [bacterium]